MATVMKDSKTTDTPKKGDVFQCEKCGMSLQVTKDCGCNGAEHVHFECCGQSMKQV